MGIRTSENKYGLAELFFLLYLVTCDVRISSMNALLQNIGYLGFIALALYRMKGRYVLTRFACLYSIFMGYSVFSLLWSINIQKSLVLLRILGKMYVMIVVATMYFTRENTVKTAMRLLYISTMISCLYVVLHASESEWIRSSIGKAQGMDTVRFAVKMSFCVYMALYYWIKNPKAVVHLAVMIVFSLLMLRTAKKTSLVFLFAAIALFMLLRPKTLHEKLKVLGGITVTVLLVIAAIYMIPALRESIGVRIFGFVKTLFLGTDADASTTARIMLMKHTVQSIKNNPVFGNGINATRSYLEQIGWNHVTYAHNNYLEILSASGIIGFVLFYSNHVSALLELKKMPTVADREWLCFLAAFLIALCICDFFQVISESYVEMLLLAFLCSGIHSCVMSEAGDDAQ